MIRLMYDFIKYYRDKAIIVATKLDKIKKSELKKNLELIRNTLELDPDDILIPYSSSTHQNREELWDLIVQSF